MKRILLITAAFISFSFFSFAQEITKSKHQQKKSRQINREMIKKSPEQQAELMTERLDKKLKFSDAQKKEVYVYNLKKAEQQKVQFERKRKDMESRRLAFKSEREEFLKLLTPEQQTLLKKEFSEGKRKDFKREKPTRKDRQKIKHTDEV